MSNELEKALSNALDRTRRQPELALIHAVELDRELSRLGLEEAITYALHGHASLRSNSDKEGAPWRTAAPGSFDCLYQAHRQFGEQNGSGLAKAFKKARGPEIPALNLLYANECLDIDSLWLHFFNKYLAYYGVKNNVCLKLGRASKFERLYSSAKCTPNAHLSGPLISVLMPIYNASVTLRKAAMSILEQTWPNLELILIDDCSRDNSLQIAHELQQQDSRVKVIALNTNGGPYIAKNVALSVAKGQYLTVHDADDWAFPTRIEDQLQPFLKPKVSEIAVSMGRTLRCDINGRFTRFQPLDWISVDGALRLCFPSPLFDRAYFDQKLGAWDSVRIGADSEVFQRIRRFDSNALQILDTPVMLQLDLHNSLTRHEETHNDDRGEAPARMSYRKAWAEWHASQKYMPKLHFPQIQRAFPLNDTLLLP
jgi:glycosyltransferase involved in cell wall biosynthesis